jgi:pilus assembly protein Flp/PilA
MDHWHAAAAWKGNRLTKGRRANVKRLVNWLKAEESGQGMVEYGLIVLLVSIAAIVALTGLGNRLFVFFEQVANAFG